MFNPSHAQFLDWDADGLSDLLFSDYFAFHETKTSCLCQMLTLLMIGHQPKPAEEFRICFACAVPDWLLAI